MDDVHELLVWLGKKINWKWFATFVITILVINSNVRNFIGPKEVDRGNFPLQQKWSTKLNDKVVAVSASENGIIFARSPYSLNALDASTGKLIWKFLLKGQPLAGSSPSLNGIVYVSDSVYIYALDERSGKLIWKQGQIWDGGGSVIEVSDNLILFQDGAGGLSIYRTMNGELLWQTTTSKGRGHDAFIDEKEEIIYNLYYGINALDAITGKELWKMYDDSWSGFFDNGIIYRSYRTGINAFDIQSQSILWEKQMDIFDPGITKYIPYKEDFIFANSEGIFAINKVTGEIKWQKYYADEIPDAPAIIGNQLFIMEGFSRVIRVYDADTGNEIGGLKIPTSVFTSFGMTTINDALVFPSGKIVYLYGK